MRPGVDVISRDQAPPRSAPTYTGVWFVVGATSIGPLTPVEIRSMGQYEAKFGLRSGGAILYDSLEVYFREGGSIAWVSAIPTTPGALSALTVDRGDGAEPEPEAEPKPAASTKTPRVAPVAADYIAALARFAKTLGPGQVSIPGQTDPTVQTALLDHAAATNRVAILDGLETGTKAAQAALATALKSLTSARYGAIFAPYAVIPGIAAGTTRHVPYSAVVAGIIGRNDAVGNPNLAAAGENGISRYSTDITAVYTDQEYSDLNLAGVDMARVINGQVETYGYRTVTDQTTPVGVAWASFGWSRLNMAIAAKADAIGERYVFTQIDGRGLTIAQFAGELRAMLLPYWVDGALFGETADDAFDVDVGNQVNTDETIAAGELHAVLRLKMSPFAEWVVIEIVKVAASEPLAAVA